MFLQNDAWFAKIFLLKLLCEDLQLDWQHREGDGVPHRDGGVEDLQGRAGRPAGAAHRPIALVNMIA